MPDTATPAQILALPMQSNDARAATIRDYLITLLQEIWKYGEGFDGKRPFGNSSWENELYVPLVKAGLIPGATIGADGQGEWIEDFPQAAEDQANELIRTAIAALTAPVEPRAEITQTQGGQLGQPLTQTPTIEGGAQPRVHEEDGVCDGFHEPGQCPSSSHGIAPDTTDHIPT